MSFFENPARLVHAARYYGIFWDWDGEKTYSKADLAERKGLTLCESVQPSFSVLFCPAVFLLSLIHI